MLSSDDAIKEISNQIITSFKNNGKLLICGNGGSAADAQHFAAELVGRFKKDRDPLPAIALTTNSSVLTSLSNDYGFDHVFERQVQALGKKEDVLFVLSTSGNSKNILNAVNKAKELGLYTVSFLGKGGGKLKGLCDSEIIVPSNNTPRVQEIHIVMVHAVCELIENKLFGE